MGQEIYTSILLQLQLAYTAATIGLIRQKTTNEQSLFVYEAPAAPGEDIGSAIASDNAIGNAGDDTNVVMIAVFLLSLLSCLPFLLKKAIQSRPARFPGKPALLIRQMMVPAGN